MSAENLKPLKNPLRRGLYIHIPFCLVKCHYCNFVITLDRSNEARARFFNAFEREAEAMRQSLDLVKFETHYWGGGTPSALSSEEIRKLASFLKSRFDFSENAEFTVEINPGDVDAEKIKALKECGMNRASVGAQAFQEGLLKNMGRPHGRREIFETVELLGNQGIDNISMDLIFRLPKQTLEDFKESLKLALSLEPAQITLYDLEVHDKTRFGFLRDQNNLFLPDEEHHLAMFKEAVHALETAGYRHYELLSFAKPGKESRHNMLYWENQEYLGLGPGAFSYLNGVRSQFAENVPRYLKKCENADWIADTQDVLDDEKCEVETLLTGLRLDRGVNLKNFPLIRPVLEPEIQRLVSRGLLEKKENVLRLTFEGKALAETVFLSLLPAEKSIKDQKAEGPD